MKYLDCAIQASEVSLVSWKVIFLCEGRTLASSENLGDTAVAAGIVPIHLINLAVLGH